MPNLNSDVCHPSALESEILLRGCTERRVRRSGPGGQHRNKVETGVVLRHESTGVEAEASERAHSTIASRGGSARTTV